MGCSSCMDRMRRAQQDYQQRGKLVTGSSTLSGATLTPTGWVKTCVMCGVQTDAAPFPEACVAKCECV